MNWLNFGKLILNGLAWLTALGIGITAILGSGGEINGDVVALTLAPMLFAFLTTAALWVVPAIFEQRSGQATNAALEKPKRRESEASGSRMSLLMELLDEDEREALKDQLRRRLLEEPLPPEGSAQYEALEDLVRKGRR